MFYRFFAKNRASNFKWQKPTLRHWNHVVKILKSNFLEIVNLDGGIYTKKVIMIKFTDSVFTSNIINLTNVSMSL